MASLISYTGIEYKAYVTQRICNYIIMASNHVLVPAVLAMGLGAY